jgi:[ribosomal protein S5]-alanine N-acetyltransferase
VDTSDILTERLRLVAITPEMMRAEATAGSALSPLLNAVVPSSWPPEHWEPHVLRFIEEQYRTDPHTRGWQRYVVLLGDPAILVGTLGAFPRGSTEAEVGYSILESWRCMGLATEGLRALISELLKSDSLESIVAQSFPALTPSIRVMEKCGFTMDGPGEEEGSVRYRLRRLRKEPTAGL